jgi:hypothetical protein
MSTKISKIQVQQGSTHNGATAPDVAGVLKAVQSLVEEVGTDLHKEGKLTPLGNRANDMNGRIDMALLSGTLTLEGLAKAVGNPNTRKSDPASFGMTCRRVKEHIHWMATMATSHGGFLNAIARVHKYPKGKAKKISKYLQKVDAQISTAFKAQFNSKGLPHPHPQ